MRRRDVLDKDNAPQCTFLIHEAALRLDFGGSAVMRSQLKHILESSERENVTVRVLPFSVGGFPYAGSSMNHVRGAVPRLDTIQFDSPAGSSLLDAPAVVNTYRSTLDRIEELSLAAETTRDFLHQIPKDL
jgi:hypothetical protein